jgi:hypothetical protein
MDRIPILRFGEYLLVTIQVDMHDQLAMTLQEDLTNTISQNLAKGVLIDHACRARAKPFRRPHCAQRRKGHGYAKAQHAGDPRC